MFGISLSSRTARLYPDGGPFNTSTLPQVGLGITKLLSLPLTNPSNPRASLSHYGNNFVYISSFLVTQTQLFEAVLRATGTSESDWKVDRETTIKQSIEAAKEKMANGDLFAGAELTYAYYMGKGLGGDYEAKAKEHWEVLGLQEEDLDEIVQRAVEGGELAKVVPKTG
jgi:hypothetical protein